MKKLIKKYKTEVLFYLLGLLTGVVVTMFLFPKIALPGLILSGLILLIILFSNGGSGKNRTF